MRCIHCRLASCAGHTQGDCPSAGGPATACRAGPSDTVVQAQRRQEHLEIHGDWHRFLCSTYPQLFFDLFLDLIGKVWVVLQERAGVLFTLT